MENALAHNPFDADFWQNRYQTHNLGWDIGAPSTPLKTYLDQLTDRQQKILLPGAGNAYEAEYMHRQGFAQVMVVDIAPAPLENLRQRCPDFPEDHLLRGDFFDLPYENHFDLILEQTFFCALHPALRPAYVQKMQQLLKPGGRLVGVLFADVLLNRETPPFGETHTQLRIYFEHTFKIRYFEPCRNSIPPRQGSEWFLYAEKAA
ncbi:MAG: methyltransferase domain-containing protein [Microscillaceae bacterium]